MLIASIIILAFFVLAYVGILIFHFIDLKKDDYECIVRTPKVLMIFAHVSYIVLCIGVSIAAVFIIAFVENETKGALIFLTPFFGILELTLLIFVTFPFVAIKGNEIYRRKYISIKAIKIEDISSIDFYHHEHIIVFKDETKITVNEASNGANEFLKLIKERKEGKIYSLNINNVEQSEPIDDSQSPEINKERMTLAQIGKEFRENFPKYKRKQQLIYLIGILNYPFVLGIVSLVFFILTRKLLWLTILILCFVVFVMYGSIFFVANRNMDKELEHDDEWLGNKHKFDNKKVKGSAKKKARILLPSLIAYSLCSLAVGVIFIIQANKEPVPQSQLVEVTGEFEYIRNSGDRFEDELAIGLKDDATEYRISSLDYPYFDLSFKTEVSNGDLVTIFIDKTSKVNSINYEGRTQWKYAYAVSAKAKDYFTYENYLDAFNKNQQKGTAIFIVSISLASLYLVAIGVSSIIFVSRSKKETIEI